MTTLTASQMIAGHERPASRDARLRGLAALAARMAHTARVRTARVRTARHELRSLDDRLLRDIGLTRDAIATLDL